MTEDLYACIHAAEFPAQSLLRLRTELASVPVAVLEGRAPLETVCSLNRPARLQGVSLGMARLEAESISGLHLLSRSAETEAAARAALLECAAHFSPRLEDLSHATSCACVLDIAGTTRLFGPPQILAERLRTSLAAAGFRVSISISANFHTARLKAAATRGIAVIPPGQEALTLAKLPLAALGLDPEHAETFAIWGIQTLGELAALPEVDLITRLGPQAAQWRALALGTQPHTFQPIEPEFSLKEVCEFDTPIDQSESLHFVAARMIDCLVARAAASAFALASLDLHMELEGGQLHHLPIRPAIPATDRKFLLKLLQLEIAAHPPQAAVARLTLTAEPGHSSKVQLGLFAPQMPEPSRLDVTIARLKAIAGEDRVGSPVLEDTHRPCAFHLDTFAVSNSPNTSEPAQPHLALRRIRPPLPVRVELRDLKPVAFRDNQHRYQVSAAYGPWKTSGAWWSADGWNTEEWDILAETANGSQVACLLVRNHQPGKDNRGLWQLEAYYD
jgi:protein ImuB